MLRKFKASHVITSLIILLTLFAGAAVVFASQAPEAAVVAETAVAAEAAAQHAWWFWPLILLVLSFVLGVFAVLAGVGGGVLYVPIVSGFLPFHLDFVRGAGLIVALAGALAAGPPWH
jgi:hypothetical protein